MGDVWPVPGGGGAASLLGRSPEQRNRSIPSGTRERDGSGWLRFPPLWETSGLSLAVVGCGVMCVLCCVEVSGLSLMAVCDVGCVVVEVCCVVCGVVCGVLCVFCSSVPSRRRCAIQNENPISRSIGKNIFHNKHKRP